MAFVFTRAPLEESLLPQLTHATKTRIESLSRLKYPAMWERADKTAATDTPEKKTAREKAAAIRHRLWGVVFLALGIFLIVPGIKEPFALTFPLIVGAIAVLMGCKRLFGKYVSSEDKQNARFAASARQLMNQLNRAQATGEPTISFSDDEMTMTTPNGSEESVPYTAMEYVIEEEDLIMITFGTRVTVIRQAEITEGDIEAFLPFMEEKTTVLYRQSDAHPTNN
ncbi:MAG: YcxB family protein [Clostridia bacterium]|nr:YcxB family protein [Clostridia bacterium]